MLLLLLLVGLIIWFGYLVFWWLLVWLRGSCCFALCFDDCLFVGLMVALMTICVLCFSLRLGVDSGGLFDCYVSCCLIVA